MMQYHKCLIYFVISLFSWGAFAANPVKVACVGNSVTFGAGIENTADRYPAQLQVLLGDNYLVKNFGHSGATLLNKGHRPYQSLPEFKQALDFQPEIVIIHLGLNDTDPRNWPFYRDDFIGDYVSLIDSFRFVNPAADIKICKLTPIFPQHPRFKSSTRDWFWQIQSTIEHVAELANVDLIDLHTPLHRRPDLFPDALHPIAEGATIIAETVCNAIDRKYEELSISDLFSSGMVLQRRHPIKFWGNAVPESVIRVKFNKEVKKAITNHSGEWQVEFPALEAGGPHQLIYENETKSYTLNDILIGDVWLCSGQSNMEFRLSSTATGSEDIPNAKHNNIRLLNMQAIAQTNNTSWDSTILQQVNRLQYFQTANWEVCTPESAGNFSAIGYHFGKTIHEETNIPIGLILNAVGGSTTESWIDRKTLEHHNRLVDMFLNWNNNDFIHPWVRSRATQNIRLAENKMQRHPYHPAYLFEAGVEKLTQLPIAGVVWYQGESNEQNVELHEELFPTLVSSWRNVWDADLPFYFVQLSSMAIGRQSWGHFRDSQRRMAASIPNIQMAVSSDLGDSTDVHPRHKKPVGERLAKQALHHYYGYSSITPSGPLFKEVFYNNETATVLFDFSEGLSSADNREIQGFELAEYPGLFFPARAEVVDDKIEVKSSFVRNPRFVRYGWASYSDGNLINKAGLPASTFSTIFE